LITEKIRCPVFRTRSDILKPDWAKIHEKRKISVFSLPLIFFSCLYGLGVGLRNKSLKNKIKDELPGIVVSVGNITAGGTGKTPAVRMLAEWAKAEKFHPAILSRGYGGNYKSKVLVVSDKNGIKTGPVEAGDEPCLLAEGLPGVPVVVSKSRYHAGQLAHEKFGTDFFILDDGFQHITLKRDFDLVLIDAHNPFGNGRLLPWGPLREPVGQLIRADAIIFTRAGKINSGDNPVSITEDICPGLPQFFGDHLPGNVIFPFKDQVSPPDFLKGKSVAAFAGIARPEAFKKTLMALGINLVYFKSFSDHHTFGLDDLKMLMDEKQRLGAEYLLATEKDWIKLKNIVFEYPDFAYLTIKFSLLKEENRFFNMLRERINRSSGK
jgi:tetraacyldisaccharide 4'-kinase